MKKILLTFFFYIVSLCLFAQGDSTNVNHDDEFNIFLLVFAVIVISVILGAAVIGAFAATIFLLVAAVFVSAGILSVSVLVGFYKSSVKAAFKTFLYIICSLVGMVMGSLGFYLISRLFHLDASDQTILIAGAISGLIGGLLMAYIISIVLKLSASYFSKKFLSR